MGLEQLAELKKQLAEEKKSQQPAKQKKSKNTNPVDPVVLIIGKLQKLYPKAFPKNPAPKVPLKIGILEDLQLRSDEWTSPALLDDYQVPICNFSNSIGLS